MPYDTYEGALLALAIMATSCSNLHPPSCVGDVKLALYGIGSVRDERLHRTFLEKNVAFMKPDGDHWFQLLTLHQNRWACRQPYRLLLSGFQAWFSVNLHPLCCRVKHGEKNYIPESFLPQDLNFVLWGHEHKCEIDPVKVGEVFISQPGSTVATALSDGESVDK